MREQNWDWENIETIGRGLPNQDFDPARDVPLDALPEYQDQFDQIGYDPINEPEYDPINQGRIGETFQNPSSSIGEPNQFRDSSAIPTSKKPDLSDEEKAALAIHFLSTTVVPLEMVDGDDYGHKCKYCDEEVRPIAEGPQHESGCQRHSPYLKYDADASHKYKCTHCDARPFVAGFHHRPDCSRGFPAITPWEVQRGDYKHECDCGVRPISEGPHHSSSCEYHAEIPLFHTERAHEYYCTHCEARPHAAGPHHKKDCQRHMDELPIPIGLLKQE